VPIEGDFATNDDQGKTTKTTETFTKSGIQAQSELVKEEKK